MTLQNSWSSFDKDHSERYLDLAIHPNAQSLPTLAEVIKSFNQHSITMLDIGCGNCSILPALRRILGSECVLSYTGIDFSKSLLDVATTKNINISTDRTIYANAESPETFSLLRQHYPQFDICLISHVIETVSSPGRLLKFAASAAKATIIRWFEPPQQGISTICELKYMPTEQTGTSDPVPYLRWQIDHGDYLAWSNSAGFRQIISHNTPIKDRIDLLFP